MLKTHSCGELSQKDVGRKATLAGWVHRRRDHGGVIFIDLRDREGLVQVVFNPDLSPAAHAVAAEVRGEYVLQVEGEVRPRPPGTENPALATGAVEVMAGAARVLNRSKTPPFYISEEEDVDELLRLRYRYLDLRRARMKDNVILRYRVVKFMRDFLDARGFLEIETPILIKSTPEGARDYLVPSRLYPGKFFALPQSPQQLKQLLMVSGFEKYFQIARCFRDEDQRADRQPEFTQLDLEMSFVDEEDILRLTEELFTALVEKVTPRFQVRKPFPRLSYAEAMSKYGNDKPDLRFGMEMMEMSDIFAASEFGIFRSAVEKGGKVKGLAAPGMAAFTRRELDELTAFVQARGLPGLVALPIGPGGGRSAAARFIKPGEVEEMARRTGSGQGDLLLAGAGPGPAVESALGQLRAELGSRLKLTDPNLLAFAFILNFPLFERNEAEGRWEPMHHPFTAPVEEDIPLMDVAPGKVRARHYDLVCNGYELSSGSIRIHSRPLQEKAFELLGYRREEMEERFGCLLEALEYGAPPHGGIAPGIDRFVMLLAGETNIREVIPFPKTKTATDPMTGSPSTVSPDQLKELHLSVLP